MKNYLTLAFISLLVLIFVFSCKSPTEPDKVGNGTTTGGSVTLTGTVVESSTGNPIVSAIIRISDDVSEKGTTTNSSGRFLTSFDIDRDKELTIIAYTEGYNSDTVTVFAIIGETVNVPIFRLKQEQGSGVNPSGGASSISLFAQSAVSIGVKESGAVETAQLIFEVQDSSGIPIDIDNSVTVEFNLGSTPGGGEFLYPSSVKTNALGRAAVTLNSGTKAGVIQVVASVTEDSVLIKSKPVLIAIHGGLPDQTHFSIAPLLLNIPGYNLFGVTDPITAFVGDKYGNPVRTNTSVYFTTTGGIIEGSALTNQLGEGVAILISARPKPEHPILGKGFATITATTADENLSQISANTIVLFSGDPYLSISPGSFDIPNQGALEFIYTLKDENDNPLAGGTTVSVKVEGSDVIAAGDVNVVLPDTQSPAWTIFYFTVTDNDPLADVAKTLTISLITTGPNGGNKLSITGIIR